MLTGEIRNQIDTIWNDFWSGGISNPLEVIEQITYLLFIRRLDDLHTLAENLANYTKKPIDVEVRRPYSGHVLFRSVLEPTLHDYQTVQFQKRVPAGEKADLLFEVLQHQGYNAKQSNVTLEQAEVKQ